MEKKVSLPVPYNYIVCFIDVLGMQVELNKFHLVPVTDAEQEAFRKVVHATVGKIYLLQHAVARWKDMLVKTTSREPLPIPDSKQANRVWSDMISTSTLNTQYWSDGVLYFSKIDPEAHAPVGRTLIELFVSAGLMLLVGLSTGMSIRGAIDIAWAAEVAPGQIFGAAVSKAYELESTKAIWPRILVSERTVTLLRNAVLTDDNHLADKSYQFSAHICLKFLTLGENGQWMIHVLGPQFRRQMPSETFTPLYQKAYAFVQKQLEIFSGPDQEYIRGKYLHLMEYFHQNPL